MRRLTATAAILTLAGSLAGAERVPLKPNPATVLQLQLQEQQFRRPAPVAKTCLCSPECTCPCNSGGFCVCPPPTVQEMLGEIKRYHDEGRIPPRVIPPSGGWRTVPRRSSGGNG
jgi:hypothetical protein